jgi:dTDP-4-amino-4,6-dideoxygalactose transaminase
MIVPPRIPFNRPSFVGNEGRYIEDALRAGHLSGDGAFTTKCQAILESVLGVPKALLTTSCTHALELAALLLDLQPGDEVILPSFTFVSTANAFVMRGARPVFADCDPCTFNVDPDHVARLVTDRTRAIVPVHYAGVSCRMDRIEALAATRGLPIVEDNAHGLFGSFRGKPLGTFGSMAALSFHETKNITCGEGGAILINDAALVERAEILREKGTDRARFFRGEVDKYTWVDLGSSWLPSDILAAVLLAQLEGWADIQARRRTLWDRYRAELRDWADARGVRLPVVPEDCEQAYHMFHILLPTAPARDRFLTHMKGLGILAVHHYVPLHSSPMGRSLNPDAEDCPVTTDISARLARLPFFTAMTEAEQAAVIDGVRSFGAIDG